MTSLPSGTVRNGVFISYSRKDGEEFALELRAKIESQNMSVWQDRANMEGGRDWWEQIKEALNHVEFMVLVMTPAAMNSDIVRKEWRYARQQGICIYPVIAHADIDIASLPRWMSSVHWYDLRHEQAKFFNDLNTRCQVQRVPFMAHDLPTDFVSRDTEFDQLKTSLLSSNFEEPIAITAALRGAGGYGKTTLATALCHDGDIQNAFDDGILWITLGERLSSAELLNKLADMIEILTDQRPSFDGLDAASARFSELLADRDILLVIDDAWRASDLKPFLNGGSRCARLVTTRVVDVLPSNASKIPVDQMTSAEALILLGYGLPSGLTGTLNNLATHLGEWPLLLKLANAWLRKRINDSKQPPQQAIRAFNLALDKRGVTAFDPHNPEERNDAVAKTLEISFASLSDNDQQHLCDLVVFKEDLNIPLWVLERYWHYSDQMDEFDVEETCLRLFDHSLLLDFSLAERQIRLHDAIRAWLINRLSEQSLADRHAHLVASYRTADTTWFQAEDDGYLYQHLAYHLVAAGLHQELEQLLLNFDWIKARLTRSRIDLSGITGIDVHGLVADYSLLPESEAVHLVGRALQMSSHVIGQYPEQLALQIYDRLATSELSVLKQLCVNALNQIKGFAMQPLRPALSPPGNLLMTIVGHKDSISRVTLLPDGRRGLSWSIDGMLRLWDLENGKLLHTLVGHKNRVNGVMLLPDGRRVLSWSDDSTLSLWVLENGELLLTLVGHKNRVNGVVLLPDERRVLSWSDDTLSLWDLENGELLHTLVGHENSINGVVLLPGGRRVLSWSDDSTLSLWDLENGELLHTLVGHENSVNGAELLPDGRRILSWSDDSTLSLWDLENGELLHTLVGHENSVNGVALLPDDQRILSWSEDYTLRIWDIESGVLIRTLMRGTRAPVYSVTVLSDGRRVLSWSVNHRLHLWDLEEGALLYTWTGLMRGTLDWTLLPDERRILSWSEDGTLSLWNLESGEPLHALEGHENSVNGAELLPDGRRILSWSDDHTLRLWDLESGELLQTLVGHENSVNGVALLPDGQRVLSWSDDRTIRLWDLESRALLQSSPGHDKRVKGMALLPDGQRVLSWSDDRTLKLWNLKNGALLHTLVAHGDTINGAVLLHDGRRALSISDYSRGYSIIELWDLESGELLETRNRETYPTVLLSADGQTVLTNSGSYDDRVPDIQIRYWGLEGSVALHTQPGFDNAIINVALLYDGRRRRALTMSMDGERRLWDLESGKLLHTLEGQGFSVKGVVALRADGRRALSWSNEHTLILWDLGSGELLHTLEGHENSVNGVELLPGGNRALSWSNDLTLRLWDLENGELLHTLEGHENRVNGVALLPEGNRALSWSDDHTLRLWDLESGKLLHVMMTGTKNLVYSAALFPQGRRKMSWSKNEDFLEGCPLDDNLPHPHTVAGSHIRENNATLFPDGRRVLARSYDGTLRLWDLESGKLWHTLTEYDRRIEGVVLSDGRQVLWSGNRLRLWDLTTGKTIGIYVADASITAVLVGMQETRIFAGDELGHIHCIALKPLDSA